jgi:ribosome-binding protein aMBF1 (putative translation factor)
MIRTAKISRGSWGRCASDVAWSALARFGFVLPKLTGSAMMLRRATEGRELPAKKPVDRKTYSGRVAARVRELREERGWRVADLVERINHRRRRVKAKEFPQSTVHGWDNGSRKIDPDLYPLLAAVFGVSVREFLPES